jgi:HAD superfamily hydrolase (TIGR01484 family)
MRGTPAGSAGPVPVRDLPARLCRRLSHFFTDIDDTLTSNGMIPAASYAALWDLASAGIRVVTVTGRPAGWCDHIARMWPVAGVVGENGAFYYAYDHARKRMNRGLSDPGLGDPARHEALGAIARRVLEEVPGTALAADQAFRLSDFAIDYCEDVPPLPPERLDDICRILEEAGVQFKVSSIHVNFWMGRFDKMSGVRRFLSEEEGSSLQSVEDTAVFIGDSPNDEPLFALFPHSVAVGNLRRFLPRLSSLPEYITQADSAEGFQEAVRVILAKRMAPSTTDAPGCTP